jgi:probable O-glycosylation ligase (exosortase A-associated)
MPYRDIILTAFILALLPACLLRPWVGILTWTWLAFMNPHRYTWGFAHDLSFAYFVAIATIVGVALSNERKPFVWTRETVTLLLLWAWFTVTSIFGFYPESAWEGWEKTSKILLMTCVTVFLFQDRQKFRGLLLVIALSIGFFGLKGGIFSLATGGQYMVLGPEMSFFSENNELALALNMCLPLLLYLGREEPRRWLRYVLRASFALSVVAVPFTYSRGGLLGLAAVLSMLFLKARRRWIILPIGVAALFAFVSFAPDRFFARVQTIEEYQADESAQLRLMAWRTAYLLAVDYPVTGGGFRVLTHRATYDAYMPEYPRTFGHDAHSIYFNLLAEHGWIGLGIFSVLIIFTMASLRRLRRENSRTPERAWIAGYADMIYVSLIGYLVNGAFLSVAYFDLAYQLLILVPILRKMASSETATVQATSDLAVATGSAGSLAPRPS